MASTTDDEPRAKDVLKGLTAASITFIVLCTLFFALRLIARLRVKRAEIGWDDYLLIPAYPINIGICALGLVMVHYESIGNPPAYEPIEKPEQFYTQLVPVLKSIYAVELLGIAGYTLPKMSLLCLYLRIFTVRAFRIATYVLLGILVAFWISFALANIFQCTPVNYWWNRLIPGGKCINIDLFFRAYSPPNIITDVLILLLPIRFVWKLEATKAKKIGLTLIFLTSIVGMIACCVRLSIFLRYSAQQITPYRTANMITWTLVEPGMYFIAACIPALRPLLPDFKSPSYFSSSSLRFSPKSWSRSVESSKPEENDEPQKFDQLSGGYPSSYPMQTTSTSDYQKLIEQESAIHRSSPV